MINLVLLDYYYTKFNSYGTAVLALSLARAACRAAGAAGAVVVLCHLDLVLFWCCATQI